MIPTLSINNPLIAFRIQDSLGAGLALINDGTHPPVALARPVGDDLIGYGYEGFQFCDTAYGIDASSTAQGFSITFTSDVAGTVYLSARLTYITTDNTSGTLTSFGRWTRSTGINNQRNCSVTLNGTTAPYMMDGTPPLTNAAGLGYVTDADPGQFHWETAVSSVSTSAPPQAFTVNKGVNTITWTGTRGGVIFEGFAITWTGQTNWQHNLLSYKPKLTTYNLAPIRAKLALASTRNVRILFIGDSLAANGQNWTDPELGQFEATYGMGGRTVKLGTPASGAADIGSAFGQRNGAYTLPVGFSGGSASFNDWSNLFGSDGYQWTQSQTGGVTIQNAPVSSKWEIIYFKVPSGGTFSVTPTGGSAVNVSTAGTAGTYGIVSGTFATTQANNQLAISKTDVASSGGVAILSARIGAATGVVGMRLAIPGTSFAADFPVGKNSVMASFLQCFQPDIIITGNANNSTHDLLYFFGIPFLAYLNTLMDSVSAGYTLLLHQDLHLFSGGASNTAVGSFVGASTGTTFGAVPSAIGPQWFYHLIGDMVQLGYWPRAMSMVSFSQYYGSLRDQMQALWSQNFYDTQSSGGISNAHLSTAGAQILGQTLGDLVTGRLPSGDDLNNAPLLPPPAADSPGVQTLLGRLAQTIAFDGAGNVKSATQNNVTLGGYAAGQDPATLVLRTPTNKLSTDATGSVVVAGFGSGNIPINHNTGGADNLRYVDNTGNGISGASILIYLATDWPSNPGHVQATAVTGADGRFLAPAFVTSGTYVAVFTKPGADGPNVSPPFTV